MLTRSRKNGIKGDILKRAVRKKRDWTVPKKELPTVSGTIRERPPCPGPALPAGSFVFFCNALRGFARHKLYAATQRREREGRVMAGRGVPH